MGSGSSRSLSAPAAAGGSTPRGAYVKGAPQISVPPPPPLYLIHHGDRRKSQNVPVQERQQIGMMAVPYCKMFNSGFPSDKKVVIYGTPTSFAQKFRIDFYAGADIAFAFRPRFDKQIVIRNSKYRGRWEHEEGENSGGFPFDLEKPFNMEIACAKSAFVIEVESGSQKHSFKFAHRMAFDQITELRIKGDITLQNVFLD